MKKFVFLYYGHVTPTQEIQKAWINWFASIGDKLVDSGNPFGAGREITHSGVKDLSPDMGAATGYSIINAESIDHAVQIAKGCPIVTGIRVYEAMSM